MLARTAIASGGAIARLIVALLLGAGLGLAQPETGPTTFPASPAEMLARLQPLPQQLKDWTMAPGPEMATGAAAAGLVPPEATETLLIYRLDWVLRLRLVPPAPHDPVTVHVMHFTDPLDAFGAFAALRPADAEAMNLKTVSFWTGACYCAWRERFVVHTPASSAGAPGRMTAEVATDAALSVMPLPSDLPLMMRLIPEARQVPHSLRYYRQNLLGRLPLGNALAADYFENGTQLQLALVRYADDEAARVAYCDVSNLFSPGACANPLALLGRGAQVLTTDKFGLVYLMHEGRYLVLALDVHDRDTAEGLLRITATDIRIVR